MSYFGSKVSSDTQFGWNSTGGKSTVNSWTLTSSWVLGSLIAPLAPHSVLEANFALDMYVNLKTCCIQISYVLTRIWAKKSFLLCNLVGNYTTKDSQKTKIIYIMYNQSKTKCHKFFSYQLGFLWHKNIKNVFERISQSNCNWLELLQKNLLPGSVWSINRLVTGFTTQGRLCVPSVFQHAEGRWGFWSIYVCHRASKLQFAAGHFECSMLKKVFHWFKQC